LLWIELGGIDSIPTECVHGFLGVLFVPRILQVELRHYSKDTFGYATPMGYNPLIFELKYILPDNGDYCGSIRIAWKNRLGKYQLVFSK